MMYPRLLAGLLDALLLAVVVLVACVLAAIVLGVSEAPTILLKRSGPVLAGLICLAYFVARDGRVPSTFGKQQFALTVQRCDGAAPRLLPLVWRSLLKLICAGAGLVGLLAPLFGYWPASLLLLAWVALLPLGAEGRSVPDRLSGCRVVKRRL